MIAYAMFVSSIWTTVAYGSTFEKDGTNVKPKDALRNCTLKSLRGSSTAVDYVQGNFTSNLRRNFTDLTFIKHNYFLTKAHRDQPASPSGCPPCRKLLLNLFIARPNVFENYEIYCHLKDPVAQEQFFVQLISQKGKRIASCTHGMVVEVNRLLKSTLCSLDE